MTQNEFDMVIARLDSIDAKMDEHIKESASLVADVRVLQSEMKFIKFVAAGLGLAFLTLFAETVWLWLSNSSPVG